MSKHLMTLIQDFPTCCNFIFKSRVIMKKLYSDSCATF